MIMSFIVYMMYARIGGGNPIRSLLMRLVDRHPDADTLCCLPPEELGRLLLPEFVTWQRDNPGQNLSLETARFRWCGDAGSPGGYPAPERDRTRAAIGRAWVWLEGQGFLIEDPHHVRGNSFRVPAPRAIALVAQSIPEAPTKLSPGAPIQASPADDKKPEMFMLRPNYMGIGIDLKELGRRTRVWFQKRLGRQS